MSEPHPLLSASLHTWEHCNTPRFTGIAIDSIDSIDYHTAKQALAQTCRSHPFGTIRAADRHLRFPKKLGLWSSQTEFREAKKSEGKLHCCMKCMASSASSVGNACRDMPSLVPWEKWSQTSANDQGSKQQTPELAASDQDCLQQVSQQLKTII